MPTHSIGVTTPSRRTRRALPAALAGLLVALGGCRSSFVTEGDALRERTIELEDQLRAAELRAEELETALAEANMAGDADDPAIIAATPRVAEISIGRLSHLRDADEDGRPDGIVVYVSPADGRGRFLQLVGRLSLHAVVIPAGSDAQTLVRMDVEPGELRDAFRSSLTGTHYTIEADFEWPDDVPVDGATVRIEFVGGASGKAHAAERAVGL